MLRGYHLIEGMPRLFWSGTEGDYNVMVMELLGPSIHDLFSYSALHFDLHTTLLIAQQLVSRTRHVVAAKSQAHARQGLSSS